ncbi:MAG: TnpV protein [Firmicutes bacterium]|nr:TnpV protein [Bacillota bacterium]
MEKYKYDESNGLWYELQGDYYLPCLQLPKEEPVHIGVWGQRHLNYLRENKRVLLSNLQISGKLNIYLADIDKQAEEMCSRLVKQMADREDITEQLKAENQMEWVRQMNNIRIRANEIVLRELIYNA